MKLKSVAIINMDVLTGKIHYACPVCATTEVSLDIGTDVVLGCGTLFSSTFDERGKPCIEVSLGKCKVMVPPGAKSYVETRYQWV